MNDRELDDLLDSWTAPPPPGSLRNNVGDGFRAAVKRRSSTPLFRRFPRFTPQAAFVACAGLFLLVLAHAAPSLAWHLPGMERGFCRVDSEVTQYDVNGGTSVETYSSAYDSGGAEIPGSKRFPDSIWLTVGTHIMEVTHSVIGKIFYPQAAASAVANCATGSAPGDPLLGYATVLIQRAAANGGERKTVWLAPALGCLTLRTVWESKQADGTFRVVMRKQALRVSVNRQAPSGS